MMPEFNEVTRQEWADEVRSGKYKQAHGVLYQPGKGIGLLPPTESLPKAPSEGAYCCLGVLSRLVAPAIEIGKVHAVTLHIVETQITLRPDWLSWEEARRLGEANDEGKSFAELADLIESGAYAND